jgi:adenine-specific DNA-methyltransferase
MIELPTQAEPVRVIEGDCLNVLPGLPDGCVDTLLTDPPYGTRIDGDGYGRRQKWGGHQRIANDGDLAALGAMMAAVRRILRPNAWVAFFCSPKRRDEAGAICRSLGLEVLGEVVWDKKSPGLGGGIRYQHETVLLGSFGQPVGHCQMTSVVSEWVPKGQHGHREQYHTHEKPVGLLRQLVRYTTGPGGLVLDPFGGSGTTAVATRRERRRCLLIEIDSTHCDTARGRVFGDAPSPQPDLFAGTGEGG